jgi:hypothetical protein
MAGNRKDRPMRVLIAPALALALSGIGLHAHAIGCDAKEYAQYKDQVRSKASQRELALDYCLNNKLMDVRPGTPAAETCRLEMAKMLDALRSAKATSAIKWAISGCPGNDPK